MQNAHLQIDEKMRCKHIMDKISKLINLLIFISFYIGIIFCSSVHSEEYVFVDKWGAQGSGDGQLNEHSFLSAAEISSSVVSGTITGWPESGYTFYFDNYVDVESNVAAWWSGYNASTPKGYFYGGNDSTYVARATGITDVTEIKDASMYSYVNGYVRDVGIGDFVLFHNRSTGYYAAFRVDNIYNNKLDTSWYLQKNKSPNFSKEGDNQVTTTILPSTSTSTSTTTPTVSPYCPNDQNIVVSGAGTSVVNGVYSATNTLRNGCPVYQFNDLYLRYNQTQWEIIDQYNNVYYYAPCLNPTCSLWAAGELGVEPVPNVSWTLPATSTISPTTTIAQSSTTSSVPNGSGITIKLDPSTIGLPAVGNTFSVNVTVENAEGLGGFQFDVTYSPAVVTVINNSDVSLGSFLGSTGRTTQVLGPIIDNTAGNLTFGGFSFGIPAGPNGSGVLATITFTVQSRVGSKLDLANINILDREGNALPVATIGSANLTESTPNTTTTSISSNCSVNNPVDCGNGICCPNNKPYCGSGKWIGRCFAIPRGNLCAASFLFREDTGTLNIFRYLRDDILERSAAGRDYGDLYYKHSPELIRLFISNPELKELARDLLNNNLMNILSALTEHEITISNAQIDEIEYLCEIIKSQASPKLQAAINKIQWDLKEGALFNNLGIKVTFN
jgi:hypothetical protein